MTSLLDVKPAVPAILDSGFKPASLVTRAYRQALAEVQEGIEFNIALERQDQLVARYDLRVIPPGSPHDPDTIKYLERTVKFLLWARGGFRLFLCGPEPFCIPIQQAYSAKGLRAFDIDIMTKVYARPFEVLRVPRDRLPPEKESTVAVGQHLDGCRIGFDLGASDYKIAAVRDGEPVFSAELPWAPSTEADPAYHYRKINEGLKQAATHLPRVDAIGGSAAGIYVNNDVRVASLFRAVPPAAFEAEVKPIFHRLQREWNVPLEVANDGDVTALAGAMSLGCTAILGIAMGSSEAAGYLDRQGRILGWLSELAFAPVDFSAQAVGDEWSGDRGIGALYFSQQAVNKLASAAGLRFPAEMKLPERLKAVQQRADAGEAPAQRIFETIGVYLGYAIPHYADFYDMAHMLILGRVMSGQGGDIIMLKAREVLEREFPDVARRVALHLPDEKSRRVGQAVAAASLPAIKPKA